MKQNKLEVIPVKRLIFTMAWPAMISMLLQAMYNLTDTVFVARFAKKAMTGVAITFAMQEVIIAVSVGTSVGISALISTCLGRKDRSAAADTASSGLLLLISESIPFILCGLLFSEPFLRFFTEDPEIIYYGSTYLRVCMIFVSGLFISTGTQRILQALGHTGYGMAVMLTGALFNLVFDPILIYGFFGFASLGTLGAAIATVVGQWISALAGIILVSYSSPERLTLRMRMPIVRKIYQIGLPSILSMLAGSVMAVFMNRMLAGYSYSAVAFYGAYTKLQGVFIMTVNGMGQAILPIIGFSYGADRKARLKEAVFLALSSSVIGGTAFTFIIFICSGWILSLFSLSDSFMNDGITAIKILSLMYIPASFSIVGGYICSGMRDGKTMLYAAIIRQIIILLPCAILLSSFMEMNGIWLACLVSETTGMVYTIYRVKKLMKTNHI